VLGVLGYAVVGLAALYGGELSLDEQFGVNRAQSP
jgi:hypothetical protein